MNYEYELRHYIINHHFLEHIIWRATYCELIFNPFFAAATTKKIMKGQAQVRQRVFRESRVSGRSQVQLKQLSKQALCAVVSFALKSQAQMQRLRPLKTHKWLLLHLVAITSL